ncbi:MAG: SpoIVB peptidase S55 domain-containing protein [Armatimonadota bacterium]
MRFRAAFALLIALPALASAAQAVPPQFDPETMMRPSEVERGMTGYGLSVFQGVEITRFDVEVLGVLTKANLGQDLILIKVTSGPVVERESGIIGGMSGSPIYVNGKLIGAIAYGWGFLREAIGGVTPIEAMLDSYTGDEQARLPDDHPARGARLDGRWVEQARIADGGPAFHDDTTINMSPVSPVINVAGMNEAGMARLEQLFAPHDLQTIAGPGRLENGPEVDLQAGSAIGVKLIDGDFDVSGVGTVTWREGEQVLAFGHPMLEIGPVEIPVTTAWIHDFLPSMQRSNKLSSPMEIVGSMLTDGSWSVAAQVGAEAPMIPATFTVTDEQRGRTNTYEVEVARHESLTSGLLMSGLLSSLGAGSNVGAEGLATLDFELAGDEGAVISRRDVVWHPGVYTPAISWVDEALYFLTENRFTPQQPASLRASISLRDDEKLAAVERVYTDEQVARAGEELTVHVVLRPEGGETFERTVTFDLPDDLPSGTLRVGAAAGGEEYSLRSLLRLLLPQIDSLEDIAEIIRTMKRSDQLYVAAAIPEITLGLEGEALPAAPTSVVNIFTEDDRSNLTAGYTEMSETFDSEHFLYGVQIARIPTENRKGERGTIKRTESESASASASAATMTVSAGGRELERMWWAASAIDPDIRPLQDDDGLPGPDLDPDGTDLEEELEEEPVLPDEDGEGAAELGDADLEHPEPDGEALARGLESISHTGADDFEDGKAEGTMVRSDGAIVLAPRAEFVAKVAEPSIWSIAADGDAAWFGTANPGRVYRWTPDGEAEVVADTGDMMVLSLLPLGDGDVLAGTAPGGRVLHIAADGSIVREWDLDAEWVWSLVRDDRGLLAGTGPGGVIYRLADEPTFLTRITQPHVFDLLYTGEILYAAGGENEGGVFSIDPAGSVRAVFASGESSCTALALDDAGRLIIATAEDGKLFAVEPGGRHVEVYDCDENVMDVTFGAGRAWAATTDEGKIVAADDRDRTAVAHRETVTDQVMRISAGDGAVFAATANPGRVWRLDTGSVVEGTYASEAMDAERMSRWARLNWDATVPEGGALQIDARSGNSEMPRDGNWSAWTGDLTRSGQRLSPPDARYLQYRLRLAGEVASDLAVRRVEALYLPQNQKPTVELEDPDPGEAIRGEYKISWKAEDDDEDTLLSTLYRRAAGSDEWVEIETLEDESEHQWDTTQVDDGTYDLRVVVSDEPSNPAGALSEEAVVESVTVDNAYPKLVGVSTPRRGDEELLITGMATDALTRIISIDWTFSSTERWRSALPTDGLLDSPRELFTIALTEIPEEEISVQIRARDAAGNLTLETFPLLDQHPEDDPDTGPAQAEG